MCASTEHIQLILTLKACLSSHGCAYFLYNITPEPHNNNDFYDSSVYNFLPFGSIDVMVIRSTTNKCRCIALQPTNRICFPPIMISKHKRFFSLGLRHNINRILCTCMFHVVPLQLLRAQWCINMGKAAGYLLLTSSTSEGIVSPGGATKGSSLSSGSASSVHVKKY